MAESVVLHCLLGRIYAAAKRCPERIALQVPGAQGYVSTTYAELIRQVEAMAAMLREVGVSPGDRVALLMPNHPRWCACFLAVLHCRAAVVPLDVHYSDQDLVTLLADCGACVALAGPEFFARLRGLQPQLPDLRQVLLTDPSVPLEAGAAGAPAPDWGEPDDMVTLIYTSGTTGDPKGVALTNASILASLDGLLAFQALDDSDAFLSLLPLSHIFAQVSNLFLPLILGARTVFLDKLTTTAVVQALQQGGITVFGGVPQLFYLLHERILGEVQRKGWLAAVAFRTLLRWHGRLRTFCGLNGGRTLFARVHRAFGGRIKFLFCGGSYLDPQVVRDFYRLGFDFLQAYGLSETSGTATITPPRENRLGSVGRPLQGVEVRIDHPQGDGVGEVLIRGPIVMSGYFRKPERTTEVLPDGWLHTGDLGRLDADGHLWITGRRKDVIVLASGKKVYPEELERHYARMAYVKELCVVGRSRGSGRAGEETVHAVIVPDYERLKAGGIASATDYIRFEFENASHQLPPFKRALSYELRHTPLPRTTTRKIKRHELKRELDLASRERGRRPPDVGSQEFQPLDSREGKALAAALVAGGRNQPLHPELHLELDLNLDSLARVELLATLEEELGVELDNQVRSSLVTVGDVVQAFQSAGPSTPGGAARRGRSWAEILAGAQRDEGLRSYFQTGLVNPVLNYCLLKVIRLVAQFPLRVQVSGLKHLPKTGPYLICPNHQSSLDGLLVAAVLPFRCTRLLFHLGQAEYFQEGIGARLASLFRVVPVNSGTNLVQSMRLAAAGLSMGKVLSIFPEGERSIDGSLRPFKKGPTILARELNTLVVPVAIAGTHRVWSRVSDRVRLGAVRIRFGPPIAAAPFVAMADAESAYVAFTKNLQTAVADLLAQLDDNYDSGGGQRHSADRSLPALSSREQRG